MALEASIIADVRLLIADVDSTNQLVTEDQIEGAYNAEGGSNLLAAARLLEAIAVSEVLVGKKITTQDLATDGAAVARELRALAAQYRARARDEDPDLGAFDGFDLVPVTRPRPAELVEHPIVWGL